MKFIVGALWATVTLAVPASAGNELDYGAVPDWASPTTLSVSRKGADAASMEVLLWDEEHRLTPQGISTVLRYAVRLNDAQALASGNLMITWNPALDQATVNSVRIVRGDQVIEPLKNGQKFTILRREQGLEQQTLDGQLTATLQTEGLQVGDILEITQTLVHRDPTLRGHVEAKAAFPYPARIDHARFTILAPKSIHLRLRTTGGLEAPEERQIGKNRLYVWNAEPLQPSQPAEGAPRRFQSGMGFEATDFRSWADLSAMLAPLFEKAATVEAASPLQAEIDRIRAVSPDPRIRAAEALKLVESQVRYVDLALGTGGLVPADADVTWQRRFGDCKAKSVLLTAILRALDIDATPMLVSTAAGDGLDERLPMANAFDHVITRAMIAGHTYWLDGTRMGDVTLDTLEPPGYKWALPLAPDAELVSIPQPPLDKPRRETIILTDASAGIGKPAPTKLEIVIRGDSAILEDMALASVGPTRRDEVLMKQLEAVLDRFVVTKTSSSYDPTAQTFRIKGEGSQTLDVDNGTYWSETPSPGYKADFRRSTTKDATAPYALGFPSYVRTVQTLILPTSVADNYPLRPADIDTTVAGVTYKRTVTRKGNAVTVDTSSRALVPEISATEAHAAEAKLRQLDNDNYRFIFPVTVQPTAAELKELLGKPPKTASEYVEAGQKFIQQSKSGEAMAMFDKAVALDPGNVLAHSARSMLHVRRGEDPAALADAEAVIKARPTDPEARSLHAMLMAKEGNKTAALVDARALALADNAHAQVTRAQILGNLGETTAALAAIDKALSYEADPLTHVWKAKLLDPKDRAGLLKELDEGIKLDPRDMTALLGLADLAREVGRYDDQLALLDKAFLLSPDTVVLRGQRAVALEQAGKKVAAEKEFSAIAEKDLTASDLNGLCWSKAVAGVELDRALGECAKSLAIEDGAAARDSRGLVLFRMGRFADSVVEYSKALENGDFASALYGRGLAYSRLGEQAKSKTDLANALKLDAMIARQYASYGLNP